MTSIFASGGHYFAELATAGSSDSKYRCRLAEDQLPMIEAPFER